MVALLVKLDGGVHLGRMEKPESGLEKWFVDDTSLRFDNWGFAVARIGFVLSPLIGICLAVFLTIHVPKDGDMKEMIYTRQAELATRLFWYSSVALLGEMGLRHNKK